MKSKQIYQVFAAAALITNAASYAKASSVETSNTVTATSGAENPVPVVTTVTRTGTDYVIVRIQNSCFGTNLRSVANPISPNGIITSKFELGAAGQKLNIEVSYPGIVAAPGGLTEANAKSVDPSMYKLPPKSRVSIFGNTVQMEIPFQFTSSLSTTKSLKFNSKIAMDTVSLAKTSFEQTVDCKNPLAGDLKKFGFAQFASKYPCGMYMGNNGKVSAQIGAPIVASDNSAIEIPVSFPGQNGFCGGYFSPLMVFFNSERPKFSGVTDFPLNPNAQTSWPEKNSPGAFLVIDKKHSGNIQRKDQLFTETDRYENGFESLATLDANHDKVIDKMDPAFKDLFLWTDKNGNAISEKDELEPISNQILSISLNYEKGSLENIGKNAQIREKSVVILKNKQKVAIEDIWLAPQAPTPAKPTK